MVPDEVHKGTGKKLLFTSSLILKLMHPMVWFTINTNVYRETKNIYSAENWTI